MYVLVGPRVCLKDTDKTFLNDNVHLAIVESLNSNMAKSTFFFSNPKQFNRESWGLQPKGRAARTGSNHNEVNRLD